VIEEEMEGTYFDLISEDLDINCQRQGKKDEGG